MTPEIGALQRFFDAVNRNDIEAATRDFDPRIVRVEPEGLPTSGTYQGLAQVRKQFAAGRGTWAEGCCEPERYLVNGEKVVVHVHVRVRLHGATDWIDARIADGFVFREGRITEYRTFRERTEALAWAGILDEETGHA
jgi:ketosteroid isomerase-like protein